MRGCFAPQPLLLAALLLTPALAAQDFSHPDSEPAPQAALIQQANDALAASDFPAALKILTGLNSQLPNNPQVLYDLGLTLEALGPETPTPTAPDSKIPTAESYYRQSISANPLFAAPHVALGLLLARTARPAEAHSELLTATQLPDAAPALKARAFRALAKLDQQSTPPNPTAASSELLAALNLTPEAPEDILLAAEIAESAADLPAAESAYRRYLALPEEAGDPQAIAALAHVLLGEHRTADAEALLTPALAAHPADPSLTALLARADISSDDPAKVAQAVPLLEKLHAANPQDANITRLLARVYLDTDHPDQADPLYAALIAAQGDAPRSHPARRPRRGPAAPAPSRRCRDAAQAGHRQPRRLSHSRRAGRRRHPSRLRRRRDRRPRNHIASARSACYSPATLAAVSFFAGNGERFVASNLQSHRPLQAVSCGGRRKLSRSGVAGPPTARRARAQEVKHGAPPR